MIEISFPDKSKRSFKKGTTPFEIAQSISEGLARNVLSSSFNENIIEVSTPLEKNGDIKLFTWKDPEGKLHFGIHLLIF